MATDHTQHWERACLNTNKSYTFDTVRLKRRFSSVSTGIIESYPLTQFSTHCYTKDVQMFTSCSAGVAGVSLRGACPVPYQQRSSTPAAGHIVCPLHLVSQSIDGQDAIDSKFSQHAYSVCVLFSGQAQRVLDDRHLTMFILHCNSP